MKTIKESLKQLNLFSHLNEKELDKLASFSQILKCTKDSILYYEEDILENIFFLVEGLITVYKYDRNHNKMFLYNINSNEMISELSSLDNNIKCFSNARVIEDSLLLTIDFKRFKNEFLLINIFTFRLLEEVITKNIRLQSILNRELVFDATSKIAYSLVNDLSMLNNLKRNEVSILLHIQPKTFSRILKKLVQHDIIRIDHGIIKIINVAELKSLYSVKHPSRD